jgi:hypothetical protein
MRHIAHVCCKVLGVYALIFALGTIQYMIPLYSSANSDQDPWLYLIGAFLPSILLLVLSAFLWLKAESISSLMVIDSTEATVTGGRGLSAVEVRKLAYFVLGLFILANAIPQLTGIFFLLAPEDPNLQMNRFLWEKIVEILVKTAIGVGLLLAGRFGGKSA